MNNILLVLCPPHWLRIPPLQLSVLHSYLKNIGFKIFTKDINVELYNHILNFKKEYLNISISEWETNNNNKLTDEIFRVYSEKFLNKLLQFIADKKISHIGFSVFKNNYGFTKKLASEIYKKYPEINIIVGGPEITEISEQNKTEMLPHYIKCIPGEGELKLRKFMNNDIIDCNAEIDNLDNLPFPDFDIFNFDFYKTKKCLPLLSSRGCINRCAFCSEKNLYRKKYRQHSAEYIVDMIAYYKKKYNISWFVFQDSLINADLKRLKKICSMILEKNLEIKWEAQVYIRKDMNTDLLSLMKKSGCYNMFIGLESGSDKILSLMNKGYNSETAALFFRKCSDAEIFFETSLIFGFPGETEKTVEETFNFFKNNSKYIKKIAQINPYVYYPLSGISNIQQKNNLDLNTIINNFLKLCNDNNIRYTKSFINNLTGL